MKKNSIFILLGTSTAVCVGAISAVAVVTPLNSTDTAKNGAGQQPITATNVTPSPAPGVSVNLQPTTNVMNGKDVTQNNVAETTQKPVTPAPLQTTAEEEEKKSIFARFWDFFGSLFGSSKKTNASVETSSAVPDSAKVEATAAVPTAATPVGSTTLEAAPANAANPAAPVATTEAVNPAAPASPEAVPAATPEAVNPAASPASPEAVPAATPEAVNPAAPESPEEGPAATQEAENPAAPASPEAAPAATAEAANPATPALPETSTP
jgi:hypothetical protein